MPGPGLIEMHPSVGFTKTLHADIPASLAPKNFSLPSPFVICVTGSATAKAYAQAGATGIILTARTASALEQAKKDCLAVAAKPELKVVALAFDVRDEESTKTLAATIQQEFGRLDVLVNNAGVLSSDGSMFNEFSQVPVAEMRMITDINYIGRLLTCKYLLKTLLESENGAKTIINITSLGSLVLRVPVVFGISEMATNRLTEYMAHTYGDQGLLTYAVHPGAVLSTPPPNTPDFIIENSKDNIGLCGAFSVWLTSEKPAWLSGRYLSATWDVEELVQRKDEIVEHDKLKMKLVV